MSTRTFRKWRLWCLIPGLIFLLISFSAFDTARADEPDLDTRIGQMIMVGFRGLAVTEDSAIVRDIANRHIGGVILFDFDVPTWRFGRNIETKEQLAALTASLQAKSVIPLLIAIDQEGGKVNRLKKAYGFPASVSQMRLGFLNDPDKTFWQNEITAASLARVGINLNLAPVVDLDINPNNPVIGKFERSFSHDPDTVTRHAIAAIKAHHRHGVLTTLKHFPGHGSAAGDTQRKAVNVTARWQTIELEPFRNLIKQGKADLVMTAHIFNHKLDPLWPATLSKSVVTDLLRRNMGFSGVVIADDLQMKAISDSYSLETAVIQAILAGVDILVLANNSVYEEDAAERAITAIKHAISTGILSETRIEESWQRIRKLKAQLKRPE